MNRSIFSLLFLLVCTVSFRVAKAEAELQRQQVKLKLLPDGDIQYSERMHFWHLETGEIIRYTIPLHGSDSVTRIRVFTGERELQRAGSEGENTFSVTKGLNKLYVNWKTNGRNEERSYRIAYQMHGYLDIGEESVQFTWRKFPNFTDHSQGYTMNIYLPGPVDPEQLYTSVRGSKSLEVTRLNNQVRLRSTRIPSLMSLQFRLLTPRSLFPDAVTNSPLVSYKRARLDDSVYIKYLSRLRERIKERQPLGNIVAIIGVIFSLSVFLFLFLYKKSNLPKSHWSYSLQQLPSNHSPAQVRWLMGYPLRWIGGHHLLVTVLDLARRGFFELYEDGKKGLRIEVREPDAIDYLHNWEYELIATVARARASGATHLSQVFLARYSGTQWFNRWKKQLMASMENMHWMNPHNQRISWAHNVFQGFFSVMGLYVYVSHYTDLGIVLFFCSTCTIAASYGMQRLNDQAERLRREWGDYRKLVKKARPEEFSRQNHSVLFAYSVALGLDISIISRLTSSHMLKINEFYWLQLQPGDTQNMVKALGSVVKSVTSLKWIKNSAVVNLYSDKA